MKGFIKILEAIIASVIILVSLTFFFRVDIKQTTWDDILLQIRGEDILASLAANEVLTKAVNENDQDLIKNMMLDQTLGMLPPTIDYSLEIRGIPNPVIYVGCVCTLEQIIDLEKNLTPLDFKYRGRDISIRIAQDSIENIRAETNILFLFGYTDLNPHRAKLENFLERGGTIFMLGDLTQQQAESVFMNDIFGLVWKLGTRSNTGEFFDPNNENITSFKVIKYYKNLTGEPPSFPFVNGQARIATDNGTVIRDSQVSLVKVNKDIINGNGRTIWMSEYVSNSATNNLTKAIVMWASGERFKMNRAKVIPAKHLDVRYIVRDKDVYEAILTLWRIFQ